MKPASMPCCSSRRIWRHMIEWQILGTYGRSTQWMMPMYVYECAECGATYDELPGDHFLFVPVATPPSVTLWEAT